MPKSSTYYHTIDAKLATNIGEDSISDPVQAILEMAKNALDADSLELDVTFDGVRLPRQNNKADDKYQIDSIIVTDKGTAMSEKDIREKWFRIGTDNKQRKTETDILGRRVVGEKGQGHYAAKRLGNKCEIISSPLVDAAGKPVPIDRDYDESLDKTITTTIDWNKFVAGGNFTEIPSYGTILERSGPACDCKLLEGTHPYHGLTIKLTELSDKTWTRSQLDRVRNELATLRIPAIIRDTKDEFNINFIIPGTSPQNARIDTSILSKALYKLKAEISGTREGKQQVKFMILKYNKKSGYQSEVVVDSTDIPIVTMGRDLECGDVVFEVYNFPQDALIGKAQLKKHGGILEKSVIEKFLLGPKDKMTKGRSGGQAGIKIYKDGVRIMPFGDLAHPSLYDWVGLDKRSLQHGGGRIRQNTVVGFVKLTRDNNTGIDEVATRQGIKESQAFRDLIDNFIVPAFNQLEVHQGQKKVTQKDEGYFANKVQSNIKTLKATVENLDSKNRITSEDKSQIINTIDQVVRQVAARKHASDKQVEALVGTNEMYLALATLGLQTLSFGHEVELKLDTVNSFLKNMKREQDSAGTGNSFLKGLKRPVLSSRTSEMLDLMHHVGLWSGMLDVFAGALASNEGGRLRNDRINLRELLGMQEDAFNKVIDLKEIEVPGLIETLVPQSIIEDGQFCDEKTGGHLEHECPCHPRQVMIKISTTYHGSSNIMYANKALILSVFQNLIMNSIKSIKYSRVIRKKENPEIHFEVGLDKTNKYLNIRCHDNGYGIAKRYRQLVDGEPGTEWIWTAFNSSYDKDGPLRGMGLGTTIIKSVVEDIYKGEVKLDGTVCEEDSPGGGYCDILINIPTEELKKK